jgi:hypothetical protein
MRAEKVPAPEALVAQAMTLAEVHAKANGTPPPVMTRRWNRMLRPRQLMAARIRDHYQQHAYGDDCGPGCVNAGVGPGVVVNK